MHGCIVFVGTSAEHGMVNVHSVKNLGHLGDMSENIADISLSGRFHAPFMTDFLTDLQVADQAFTGNDVLIGMGAVIMDNAVVPDGTVVAAGAVVLANTVLEPGIWAGVPAKKVKDASEKIQAMAHDNARHYLTYKEWYE
jgi:acetyltransferase-like isoleucine patch superfamily enzyme